MSEFSLLSDDEIKEYSDNQKENPLICDFLPNNCAGGSYVLRIGNIYMPSAEDKPSLELSSRKSWEISAGQMIVVTTLEKLSVPRDKIGFVFGVNTLTSKGLLIVNPGIITSGHERQITFYAINFSKTTLSLSQADDIGRIAFLRSSGNTITSRNVTTDAEHEALKTARERFFSDFEGYFHSLAKPWVSRYFWQILLGLGGGGFAVAIIVAVVSVISPVIAERVSDIPEMQQDLKELRLELDTLRNNVQGIQDTASSNKNNG